MSKQKLLVCLFNASLAMLSPSCFGDETKSDIREVTVGAKISLRNNFETIDRLDGLDDGICGVSSNGMMACVGDNWLGLLGTGKLEQQLYPQPTILFPDGIRSAHVASGYHCVITATGELLCWGELDRDLRLPDDTVFEWPLVATKVEISEPVTAVAIGRSHACAATVAGAVLCWGANRRGQLGNGTTEASATPVVITGLTEAVVSVSAGWADFTCALSISSKVYCWGVNDDANLGVGMVGGYSPVPVKVLGIEGEVDGLVAGVSFACVHGEKGTRCWGTLGTGGKCCKVSWTRSTGAMPVANLGDTSTLFAGAFTVCGTNTGQIRCNYSWNNQSFPARSLVNWDASMCAQLTNGTVSCWGRFDSFLLKFTNKKYVDVSCWLTNLSDCGNFPEDTVECYRTDPDPNNAGPGFCPPADSVLSPRLLIGDTPAEVQYWSASAITATVPKLSPGTYTMSTDLWGHRTAIGKVRIVE
jgi:hypothetical protein